MKGRYFVIVSARDKRHLHDLQSYPLDVFAQTARNEGDKGLLIDGLMTLDDVGELVTAGYEVTVRAPMAALARGPREKAADVDSWLQHRRARRKAAAKGGE